MPYRIGHWNNYGGSCVTNYSIWFPGGGGDFNDTYRNQVTYAYMSLFGRYGEQAGVEGYVGTWVYGTGQQVYGTITNMVKRGGISSGEYGQVQSRGRHTGMASGTCPPPIIRGCTNPNAVNYNPSAQQDDGTCYFNPPYVNISVSPTSFINPGSATLYWSTSNTYSRSISGIGGVSTSGSMTVSPTSTTTYTLVGYGYGGTRSNSAVVYVYQPPQVTLTLDNSTIVIGETTRLRWTTTGDASTMTITPGIGSTNLVSNQIISPTITTTYTATASGLGGTDSQQITITVIQPPEVDLAGPLSVNYGDDIILSHEQVRATTTYELRIKEYDLDSSETDRVVDLGFVASGTYTDTVVYHDRGPSSIRYELYGEGAGGLQSIKVVTVPINIDQRPDAVDIPSSEDKLRDEQPVITPDAIVTSEQIVVEDVDLPVEIKSNYPIQVEVDGGTFIEVREI